MIFFIVYFANGATVRDYLIFYIIYCYSPPPFNELLYPRAHLSAGIQSAQLV